MKLLLISDDLIGKMRLESLWAAEGATVLKKSSNEHPDCIVIDLASRDVLARIADLRARFPKVGIVAYAAKFDEALFAAARAAGASEVSPVATVMQRVARHRAASG